MPELTTPAEVGHVLAGKEYIDGNGNKRAGTLVVCDSVVAVEDVGIAGTGVSLEFKSTADGSTNTLTLPEPNLLPENIVDGASIFGVLGIKGGAQEPYTEETYDDSGNLLDAKLHGYKTIRDNMFNGCTKRSLTALPDGITAIGNSAFSYCREIALTALPDGITAIGNFAFNGCANLALTALPDGITAIGNYTFDNCANLALTALPDGITAIGNNAFNFCYKIAITDIPAGVTTIGNTAFRSCIKLTSITFKGTPDVISATAFDGCTNLHTINVPWNVGDVADAPWGAVNATINYNYTV